MTEIMKNLFIYYWIVLSYGIIVQTNCFLRHGRTISTLISSRYTNSFSNSDQKISKLHAVSNDIDKILSGTLRNNEMNRLSKQNATNSTRAIIPTHPADKSNVPSISNNHLEFEEDIRYEYIFYDP